MSLASEAKRRDLDPIINTSIYGALLQVYYVNICQISLHLA